jgi:hypothetical protein
MWFTACLYCVLFVTSFAFLIIYRFLNSLREVVKDHSLQVSIVCLVKWNKKAYEDGNWFKSIICFPYRCVLVGWYSFIYGNLVQHWIIIYSYYHIIIFYLNFQVKLQCQEVWRFNSSTGITGKFLISWGLE